MIRKTVAILATLTAALTAALCLASPAAAATTTCRNVEYTVGDIWTRVCLTYTWSGTGSTYNPSDLRAWNPPSEGPSSITVGVNMYDNSPSQVINNSGTLSDNQTELIGDHGFWTSASKFQCVDILAPPGSGTTYNSLSINPGGSLSRTGSCAANGVFS